jgi:hypothetical protein
LNNTGIGAIAGIALVLIIAFVFALFPAQSEDTIFFIQKDGSTPEPCTGNVGLVLAQNITDLCDVDAPSPTDNQFLRHNGTQWINESVSFGTGNVTSVTSNSNSTIGVVPTDGDVVLYPKYELLCQTTLVSSNASIVCNISATKYLIYQFEFRSINGTGIEPAFRFNGDSGTNYARRTSTNGAADQTGVSSSRCNIFQVDTLVASTSGGISAGNIYNNQSGERKLVMGNTVTGLNTDQTSLPSRAEFACKWSNTSAQITTITAYSHSGTGSYNTGSVLTVWGYN